MEKLRLEESPQIRESDTVRSVMLDVCVSLLPAYVWGIYLFGLRALTIGVLSVGFCLIFEALYQKILKRPITVSDGSAALTGLLLALSLPVSVSLWIVPIGAFFAIVIAKHLIGGLLNFAVNPALSARVFLFVAFSSQIRRVTEPFATLSPIAVSLDPKALESAVPDGALAEGLKTGVFEDGVISRILIGSIPGGIGQVSAVLLLAGLLYLAARRLVTWHIPVCFLSVTALLTVLFPEAQGLVPSLFSSLFGGGVVFAAVYFATDYSTSPLTGGGKALYGVLCAVLSFVFRRTLSSNEGAFFAVFLLGLGARYLDLFLIPRSYGSQRDWKKMLSFLPLK